MCARNSPCQSPPRARSSPTSSENPTDDRFRHQQPPHPPYIPYYPPPPPYLNPYGPYPYHPPGGYYTPYCNDVQEPKGVGNGGSSWFGIVLFFFLLLFIVSFIFYRSLSRDTQRRLHDARLPTLIQPAALQDHNRDRVS
ncbi:cyclin-K-like [Ceratina calcarata]|uniref:Cyclin-K-like n=1 Tax=Ceratina calcarata TaxID=156304 RepID=A0AAJ7SDW1_9HYME|nr:cyclin-K-like [Ceratina calcarata]